MLSLPGISAKGLGGSAPSPVVEVMKSFIKRIADSVMHPRGEAGGPRSEGLVYAIGDVHGRADLLVPLAEKILVDVLDEDEPGGAPRAPVVILGDMIDRGPDSRGVLEFLCSMHGWPELELILLGGNHEAMLFDFLSDPAAGGRWLQHGGYETVQSYGLERIGDITSEADMRRLGEDLQTTMGPHLDLLLTCQPFYRSGNLAFVHAAADPALAIEDQPHDVLLWGSPAFQQGRRDDGIWVVHGHEIVERPDVRRGRISLDTGAYAAGKLTMMKIRGADFEFLTQTG